MEIEGGKYRTIGRGTLGKYDKGMSGRNAESGYGERGVVGYMGFAKNRKQMAEEWERWADEFLNGEEDEQDDAEVWVGDERAVESVTVEGPRRGRGLCWGMGRGRMRVRCA